MTFQAWIQKLISERFGTQTALANAIGLQLTPFTRGVATGTFSIVNLLRLAKASDTAPSQVLQMAGKGDVAELIESLYGDGSKALTQSERALLVRWRLAPAKAKTSIETILEELVPDDALAEADRPVKKKRSA